MLSVSAFQKLIYEYYSKNKRQFVWRDINNPYWIFVSEVMLQQTQTFRVEQKFLPFVQQLPTFFALAQAPFAHVLTLWKGLGYNRRALYLQQAAHIIVQEYAGSLPADPIILQKLPGIGSASSRSIAIFAFNEPYVFIETNIRAVFIHHFFEQQEKITDQQLLPLVESTLDRDNPRQWYYALMDYGVMLKKLHKNPARKSAHYTRQSRFEGSLRQVRGKILKILLQTQSLTSTEIVAALSDCEVGYVKRALCMLVDEKLVQCVRDELYYL